MMHIWQEVFRGIYYDYTNALYMVMVCTEKSQHEDIQTRLSQLVVATNISNISKCQVTKQISIFLSSLHPLRVLD